jgi:hypothetical protein
VKVQRSTQDWVVLSILNKTPVLAKVIAFEVSESAQHPSDLTNASAINITPMRARRCSRNPLRALQKGTRACNIIVGEREEANILIHKDLRLKELQVGIMQREIICEVCVPVVIIL